MNRLAKQKWAREIIEKLQRWTDHHYRQPIDLDSDTWEELIEVTDRFLLDLREKQ